MRHDFFGVGFLSLLFLLFLGLKLGRVIDWSWVWVFAPLWIPFVLALVVVLFVLLFMSKGFKRFRRWLR